jgi:A/G-specific adenine glycosylase
MFDPLFFRTRLLEWHATQHRPMPWKGEKDPYKVWLSEVMLQQTRVEQGWAYYERFLERFPTVQDLAEATEDEVFRLWQGLGYYRRARNLHAAAQHVAGVLNGKFPETFEGLRALKGVGDYTAAAVASFVYNLPHAVLDGNVYRVLSRFWGIETPLGSGEAQKTFAALAQNMLDPVQPAVYNQAIMDFGATQCKPRDPDCGVCPLREKCFAAQNNRVSGLPVKIKAAAKKTRYFLYIVLNAGDEVLLVRRGEGDVWSGLYDFPVFELSELPADKAAAEQVLQPALGKGNWRFTSLSEPMVQVLTHQKICAVFAELEVEKSDFLTYFSSKNAENAVWAQRFNLKKMYALPRLIDRYVQDNALTLRLF